MLPREAKWFGNVLAGMPDADVFPMLNVGSHTEEFRTREQPWNDRHLFAPARRRGQVVRHLDLRAAPGVDIVGDLSDPAFLAELRDLRFRSVFCSNLLEHVANPGEIARALTAAVPEGGYLFISAPHRFPYHPDPIDTMFRPGPDELAALFPGTHVHRQALVRGTLAGYLLGRLLGSPGAFARSVLRRFRSDGRAPAEPAGPGAKAPALGLLPWLFKSFEETCLVLRKEGGPADGAPGP
jgi:hypothetical protein